jgi:hypothetical protein
MGAGDKQFTIDMLEMFLDQVPKSLNAIIKGVNSGNKKNISVFAHTSQSSFVIIERVDVRADLKSLELWGKEM